MQDDNNNEKPYQPDWRHDGPLSARNDEKHTPPAMKAAIEVIATIRYNYTERLCPNSVIEAIIDREAVKPATAELLAALRKMLSYAEHSTQGQSAIKTESRGRSLTKSQADFLNDAMTARAVIARHEART